MSLLQDGHFRAALQELPRRLFESDASMEGAPGSQAVVWHGIAWSQVLFFAVCWEVVYILGKRYCAWRYSKHPKVVELGGSYVVAFLNAVVCSCAGLYALYSLHDATEAERALMQPATGTPPASAAIAVALNAFFGYLLSDLKQIATWYPALGGGDMVVHHVMYILLAALGSGFRIAPLCAGWLLSGEVSSLFLNARWLLINSGRGESRTLHHVQYAFALTFFLGRVLLFWSGLAHVMTHELPFLLAPPQSAPFWALVVLVSFVWCGALLNAFWFIKIVKMALNPGPPPGKARDMRSLREMHLSSPRREGSLGGDSTSECVSECDSISVV